MSSERLEFAPTTPPSSDTRVDRSADQAVAGDAKPTLSWRENLKAHRRTWSAIRGLRETLLIGGVYTMYDLTRYLVAGDHDGAISHGKSLLDAEKKIGIAPEHALNHLFSAHLALGLTADYMYATLHYIVTPAVLIWMWRRNGPAYSWSRTILVIATILGLIGFSTLPVAPPRLLGASYGFIDTMAKFSRYGWWSNAASAPRGLGGDTNQYAALPSLHVGWALWSGWMLVKYGKHRTTKVLGVLYPIALSIVVMATANHYLLDVVAGVVTVFVAYGLVELLGRFGVVTIPGKSTGPPEHSLMDPSPPDAAVR